MLIKARNRTGREVPACFARCGTGWYGTLKVNTVPVAVHSVARCDHVEQ